MSKRKEPVEASSVSETITDEERKSQDSEEEEEES